jgi:hypothetical protein
MVQRKQETASKYGCERCAGMKKKKKLLVFSAFLNIISSTTVEL